DADARAAGVTIETLGALVDRDPDAARLLLSSGALPTEDRLAQLTRAGWNQGVHIRVPAGKQLDRPIVVRWGAGAPGRALLTRTIVELGEGAAASVLEELVPSGPEIACAEGETVPQSLFTGTLEVPLLDAARSYMKGLIVIERPAVGTDSFLGEFGMNLSKRTRAVAIPSLEIDQPDCRRAAHSSSVGPIDETQLFYLESRGIPPDEARKFIVLGFLEPVVARVPLEDERERLRGLLEAKWNVGLEGAAA